MSKINYHRKKWIIKTPVKKVNKVQTPDVIYNRNKQKKNIRKELERINENI